MQDKLKGLYVITDNSLTPNESLIQKVEKAIKGGAKIIQLRDKENPKEVVEQNALNLQKLCKNYGVQFVLNDDINLAIKHQFDGLHIGKSDYSRIKEIKEKFKGFIGVSCYEDIKKAKEMEKLGIDYVAFGSFFKSPTKPNSKVVPLNTLLEAKKSLSIPICAIGGINEQNLDKIKIYKPEMISMISDIWTSEDILEKCKSINKKLKD